MRKKATMLLAMGMVLLATGCGNGVESGTTAVGAEKSKEASAVGSEAGDAGDVKSYTIGYSFANVDENNQRILNVINSYVEELNATGEYNIKFLYTDAQSQVDKQIADVESMIQKSPDLIAVSAVDLVGSVPCEEAIHNAGIICVDMRGCKTDVYDYRFVGFDEDAIGEMKAKAMRDYLEANPDVNLKVGCIYGLASQTEQLKRVQCILKLAEEMPDRITILETQYCDWSTDKATSTTEDWLIRYPDMNCIVTASDDMGLGVCNALKANGKKDFYVDGVDGTKIGISLCEDGTQYYVTVGANQTQIQRNFIDVAIKKIEGEFTEDVYRSDASCFKIITRDNVAEHKIVQ